MNTTDYVVKLIKVYNAEQNRLRRARYAIDRIRKNKEWMDAMSAAGLGTYFYDKRRGLRRRLNHFVDKNTTATSQHAFVSKQVKAKHLAEAKRELDAIYRELQNPQSVHQYSAHYVSEREKTVKEIEATPVRADLAKNWRKLIRAYLEENAAYEDRWQARCAIKAWNKMDLGPKIKFGGNHGGEGAMNCIRYVEIDGYKMPYRKFIEQAEFERVILAA